MGILSTVTATATTAFKVAKTFAVVNSPIILLGAAAVGVISTAVIAWKAGKKSSLVLGKAKKEKGSDLTTGEKVKATWKLWVPVVVAIILTFVGMAGSYYIENCRLAEMTATANALLTRNNELMYAIEEADKLSDGKVKPEVTKQLIENNTGLLGNNEWYDTLTGDIKFYDYLTGQKFLASTEHVAGAITKFVLDYKNLDERTGIELPISKFYTRLKVPAMNMPLLSDLCYDKITWLDEPLVPNIQMEWTDSPDGDGWYTIFMYPRTSSKSDFGMTADYDEESANRHFPAYVSDSIFHDQMQQLLDYDGIDGKVTNMVMTNPNIMT
jgi:hypothetical protein